MKNTNRFVLMALFLSAFLVGLTGCSHTSGGKGCKTRTTCCAKKKACCASKAKGGKCECAANKACCSSAKCGCDGKTAAKKPGCTKDKKVAKTTTTASAAKVTSCGCSKG